MIFTDKIIIKGLKIFAYHGVNPEEKQDGQNFILDIVCYTDFSYAAVTDDLNQTVSYAKIIKTATKAFCEKSYDLIEAAANAVTQKIFDEYEKIKKIDITLKKPEAPIKADFDYVAVEFTKERKNV